MSKTLLRSVAAAFAAGALVTAAPAPAGALPTLPTDAGNITPDIDWSKFISPLVKASTSIKCTVVSSTGVTNAPVGKVIDPLTNQMTDGLDLVGWFGNPAADVGTECTTDVEIPATPFDVSGTFTAPGMASVAGVGSTGSADMRCSAVAPTPKVQFTVTARFGGAVPNKARIAGKTGASNISFDCSMALSFTAGATLAGTVEGTIEFANRVANSLCDNQVGTTCIQASVTNAAVNITGGGGALSGSTGTGTYSFNDLFALTSLDDGLKQAMSMGGIRGLGVRSAGVGAQSATSNADQLLVTLLAGKHTVRMLRPKESGGALSVGAGGQIDVVSSPSAKCSLSARSGRNTVSIGSATLPKNGARSFSLSSAVARKMKAAKITKGKKFTLTVTCTSAKKTASLKKTVTYSG
ncbi:MAG: hypothetical protein ACKOFF_04590 [Acidimicrobiales bacterium]